MRCFIPVVALLALLLYLSAVMPSASLAIPPPGVLTVLPNPTPPPGVATPPPRPERTPPPGAEPPSSGLPPGAVFPYMVYLPLLYR